MTIRFDAPHGGYPGEVIAHETYLRCEDCGQSFPLEALEPGEPCDCGAGGYAIIVERVHPAPQGTMTIAWPPTLYPA